MACEVAKVIRKVWLDQKSTIEQLNKQALRLMLHCRRQQLIRKAASHGGTVNINNDY
jgi:hypothetical protein